MARRALPITELHARQVALAVERVRISDGYHHDLVKILRPTRRGLENQSPEDLLVVVEQDSPERLDTEDEAGMFRMEVARYSIHCFRRTGDDDQEPIEAKLNLLRADVERALMVDRNMNGTGIDGHIGDADLFDYTDGSFSGVTVMFLGTLRWLEADPYDDGG